MKTISIVSVLSICIGMFLGYKLKPDQEAQPIVQSKSKCEAVVKKVIKKDGTVEETVSIVASSEAKSKADQPNLKNSLILQQDQISYSRKIADIDLLGVKLEVAPLVQARKDNSVHFGLELRF